MPTASEPAGDTLATVLVLMFDDDRVGAVAGAGVVDLAELVAHAAPRARMTALIERWLELELRLNGAPPAPLDARPPPRRARLIERYSQAMTLEPGDVATATPDEVGPAARGDEVDLRIGRVGRLVMRVVARG
jgi:hypothetical protein